MLSKVARKHRLRLCSTIRKEQILAQCQARTNRHEFRDAYDRRSLLKLGEIVESQQEELHLARAEEVQQRDQQLLQGQVLQQNLELCEAHQRSLTEMEELREFQSSTFDTIARRKLVKDQNTILELSVRIQELKNEINGMNDSRDFLDAESIRMWKFPRYQSTSVIPIPPHPIPEGMVKPFLWSAEPQRRAAKQFGPACYIGKRFCRSSSVFFGTLSSRIESMEFFYIRTHITTCDE